MHFTLKKKSDFMIHVGYGKKKNPDNYTINKMQTIRLESKEVSVLI